MDRSECDVPRRGERSKSKGRKTSDRPSNHLRASDWRDICGGFFTNSAPAHSAPKADGVTMTGGHGQGACRPCPKGVSREAANIKSRVYSESWVFARLTDRRI